MSDEIIIKTETVKVDELEGREKQIYDFAYSKGYDSAIKANMDSWSRLIVGVILIGYLIFALSTCGR